jgi:hypothetical protein
MNRERKIPPPAAWPRWPDEEIGPWLELLRTEPSVEAPPGTKDEVLARVLAVPATSPTAPAPPALPAPLPRHAALLPRERRIRAQPGRALCRVRR